MTTAVPSTALATIQPAFTDPERLALAGFLAGYRGLTREAYTLDLRQFTTWCRVRSLNLYAVRRADIECFARDLEAGGRARATVTRRLCTIAAFYHYAVEEELLEHSPAAHVRRPRVDYESHATALDRNELGAMLVAAGLGLPLAPRTARAIDLATLDRCDGPIFLTPDGRRLDRHGAGRIVRKVARQAGITKKVGPHTLRHAFITAAQRRGVALDATFRARREDDAVRGCCPGTAGRRSRRQSEPAGQDSRDRTVLRQMPGCCIDSRCIRCKHDAAKGTKNRSDEGRCH